MMLAEGEKIGALGSSLAKGSVGELAGAELLSDALGSSELAGTGADEPTAGYRGWQC